MNKILVPIDFSDNSMNALEFAVKIAKEISAEITLFNSYPLDVPMGMEYSSGIYMQTLSEEVKLDHQTRLQEIALFYADECYRFSDESIAINIVVQEGVAADSIVEIAEKAHFTLIVMGTQGASGLEEVFLGSITGSVINKSRVPVLAIPEKAKFQGFKKVVYATDFDNSDERTINALQDLAEIFDAEITCVHVSTEPTMAYAENQKMDALKRNYFFAPVNKINFELIFSEKVATGLEEYLAANQVNLLVVKPQNRSFVESIFHSSLTKKLAYHTKIPLLVARGTGFTKNS